MKSKSEFYQAYFALLEQKGFSVTEPSSPDYLVDICYRGTPIAFYTKQDYILKNPFVEVQEKMMEKLYSFAKTTALTCGICSEKPYEEEKVVDMPNQIKQINEHNGVVLACRHHPLFAYVLSTYKVESNKENSVVQRQYFYNKEEAFESFATRSGLVDEKKLFRESELKVLYSGLVQMGMENKELSADNLKQVEQLVDKIEDLIPELRKKEKSLDFSRLFSAWEHNMER